MSPDAEKVAATSFRDIPAFLNSSRMSSTCFTCYSIDLEIMMTSYKYTKHVFQRTPVSIMSNTSWNVAGSFRRPKDIRL